MITKSTVLILGAGASSPYGFPTGEQLLENVHDDLVKNERYYQELGFPGDLIISFRKDLLYSARYSVDAFLEKREEFIILGKAAIARILIPFENTSNLFPAQPKRGNWYKLIFNKLDTDFDDFDKNSLSVITFNYDRSFEQYLITAMMTNYKKAPEECAAKLNSIPIVHVYGKLGALPFQDESLTREYEPNINPPDLLAVSEGIKIISERSSEVTEEFTKAKKLISAASREKVVFLGFGYHDDNLKRIGKDFLDSKYPIGSSFKLKRAKRQEINGKWGIRLPDESSELDVLDFLETHVMW